MVAAVVEGEGLTADLIDVGAIQTALKTQLADYKVPKKIYPIASMQRAANGKIDYKFLINFAEQCLAAE
jgi:acyl-CoA synthetase (AMP-forming)/AMP-acid ligase II